MTKKTIDKSKQSIRVVFSRILMQPELLTNSVIYIAPNPDRWNDFGFRTKIDIHIHLEGEGEFYTEGFIGFLTNSSNESNGVYKLNQLLENTDAYVLPDLGGTKFFTMLPNMESYRKLSRTFGIETAVTVLKSINDLVAIGEFKPMTNWLGLACKSEVFLKSFMRTTESFFAFNNAGSILRGLESEEFRKLSNSLAINFQLPGKLNPHEMLFRFNHYAELPKRIAVIIGENGVGKSQTLGRIVSSAINGSKSLIDADTQERPMLNRILAFAPTNEAGSVFPSDRRRRSKVWYKRFALNRSGPSRKNKGNVSDLIIQTSRADEYLGGLSRWELFLDSLKTINGWHEISLSLIDSEKTYIKLGDLSFFGEENALITYSSINIHKDPVRVISGVGYPLSSGEISFLRFAAQASLYVENGSLLLLDEPETHLHPSFISNFIALLDRLLELSGSAAIIATHSAYVVREVFPEQVTVLRVDKDGFIETPKTALQTFGADVGAISYFVFNEDEPSRLALGVKKRLLEVYDNWDDLYSEYKNKLSLEILSSLRQSLEAEQN
ncbi:AAA family ATPase [Pseudomonas cichorii]|uniref:AAA family ATPase n=1 Tax=Pseudomonas cichorii TaxID=36746 RepID=UPI001C892A77|nr:AAA family ATPase [Pseudomonas cichorii]MBX8487743.1 AAA family ATPase [Pseudomonas cichorii]